MKIVLSSFKKIILCNKRAIAPILMNIVTHKILITLAKSFNVIFCNMNSIFSFDLVMVFVPECKQQLGTMK